MDDSTNNPVATVVDDSVVIDPAAVENGPDMSRVVTQEVTRRDTLSGSQPIREQRPQVINQKTIKRTETAQLDHARTALKAIQDKETSAAEQQRQIEQAGATGSLLQRSADFLRLSDVLGDQRFRGVFVAAGCAALTQFVQFPVSPELVILASGAVGGALASEKGETPAETARNVTKSAVTGAGLSILATQGMQHLPEIHGQAGHLVSNVVGPNIDDIGRIGFALLASKIKGLNPFSR